jgi:hypothetical protein
MNKRGFLLGEETVKIILAAIAIIFLILFIVYLYNNYNQNKLLDEAKGSLNNLITQINSGATQINIYNPKAWFLSSWPHDFATAKNILPKPCLDNGWKKCLCICEFESIGCGEGGVAGICVQNDFVITGDFQDTIPIQDPPLLLTINQQNKTISKTTNGP